VQAVNVARPRLAAAQAAGSPLKIGMVGAGREGSALAMLFAKAGHPVMLSSRHPEELKALVASLGPVPYSIAPCGQDSTHSEQNRQRPRSRRGAPASTCSAPVGQASTQARQPSRQRLGSMTGAPRKRSGSTAGRAG